jgi:hypothetical protein
MLSRADLYTSAESSAKSAALILKHGLLDPADATGSTRLETLGNHLAAETAWYLRALESLDWSLKAARSLDVLEQNIPISSSLPRIHNSTKYSSHENWIKIAKGIGLNLTVGKK